MKKRKNKFVLLFALCCLASWLLFLACPLKAAAYSLPTALDNLDIGLRSTSKLVATEDGYMRVFYDGAKIGIEYYDDDFTVLRKQSLEMELSIWGGFYAGSDSYYIVEGQANKAESDTAEVIRVIRYDKDWAKIGTAKITGNPELFGGEVRYPFDYGCVEMAEHGGTLYLVTGHQGYVDPAYNQGHQGFLLIAVDEASMTGRIVDSDLWHSFAQYITCKEDELYVLEQSEGSRCTTLSRYDTADLKKASLSVLEYGGTRTSAWAIPCYASVDGMAVSSDHVLCLGTSIDQSNYDSVSADTAHNIYLTVTPTENYSEDATTVKWLTDYSGDGKCFLGTKITRINDDRFLVSWEEYATSRPADVQDGLSGSILHYLFIDGKGNAISREFTAAASISDCQPVVKGSNVVYYASNSNMVNFYSINAENGSFDKTVYRVAGEAAAWDLKESVLTISGTGPMAVDTEVHFRYPVSTVLGGHSYSSSDNVWKPVREHVKKIVVGKGITEISEHAFAWFENLTEVEIEPGVKSIGKMAFYSCEGLAKITIPASVTSIGEDFLWTGSYWVHDESHVVKAAIYAPENSYAVKYARENGIRWVAHDKVGGANDPTNTGNSPENAGDPAGGTGNNADGTAINIAKAKVSGIKASYAYNGKAHKPNVVVKLNGKTLKKGIAYTISYTNNKKTGKASVIIKGVGNYTGTLTKTFKIVPKKAVLTKWTSSKASTIRVSWKKDTQASGYQIQYAKNKKFTKGKTAVNISRKSTVTKKLTKLSGKKMYYIRIRVYKKISGKKCYGAWSKVVKVKCK